MNLTNVKLIWRNLLKNANVSAINIVGLSVSLAICALIGLYLNYEYGFDKHHADSDRFYRLNTTFKYPNSPERQTVLSSPMMGPYLTRESDLLDQFLRLIITEEDFVGRAGSKEVTLETVYEADSSFFEFFDFPLLYGSKENAFDHLTSILITEEINDALFAGVNSVGETLEHTYALDYTQDTTVQYRVSGVFAQLPGNTHLQFDALTLFDDRQLDGRPKNSLWHGVYASTYFRSSTDDSGEKISGEFAAHLAREMPNSEMVGLSLQPFEEIHLHSMHLEYDTTNAQKTDAGYLRILGIVALFILLISCINFANLTTVLSMRRIREVGVRKSLGATKNNVVVQFLTEALMFAVISGGLALFWMILFRPFLLDMIGRDVPLTITPLQIAIYILCVVSLGLITGLFPAIRAAGSSALGAFQQGSMSLSIKRPFIRRLVVLQFVLSGVLILGSLVSREQFSFLAEKDLGFTTDGIIEMNLSNGLRAPAMSEELAAIPGVLAISGSDMSLGSIDGQNGVMVRNAITNEWENYPMSINRVRQDYFELYDIEFIQGRAPTLEGAESEREFVVNEMFLEKVGWADGSPLGREIWRAGQGEDNIGRLVGVIKNVHHNSLHNAISPICFQASDYSPILSLKVRTSAIASVLERSQEIWRRYIKEKPFTYRFKDEQLAAIYASEHSLGKLLTGATLLSILFSCLGLLALSSFIIQQRTKEIGIRKVLGSSVSSIVALLSKDFLQLILLALIFALPLGYLLMGRWLQNFAYSINIHLGIFILAVTIVLGIALLTISLQSVRAAMANPVDSIRTD